MFSAISSRDIQRPLLRLSRWLLKWGQIPVPILLGLALGALMFSPARDFIVSLVGIAVYLIAIILNPLGGLLLWAVAYPFAEGALKISLGSAVPDLTPTRFCFAFLTATLLAQAAIGRRVFPRLRGAEIAALLFAFGMFRSAPAAADPINAMQVIFDALLMPVLAYFLTKNLLVERRDLEKLFSAFIIVGTYTAAIAIYEQLTGITLFFKVQEGMAAGAYSENVHILNSLYGDANALGLIIGLTLLLAFHRFIEAPSLGKKILYAILIVLMLGGELATFKRVAWLSSVVSLLIVQFFYPEFRRIFLVLLVLFAAMWFVAGDQIAGSEVGTRATYKVDSANGRTERWEEAIELWKQKPLTGHGYKRFDDLASMRAVESYYLHILVSAGLIAFLPFLAFIVLVIADSIVVFRQAPDNSRLFVNRRVIAILWGMLAIYLITCSTNYMAIAVSHIVPYILIGAIVGSQGALLERRPKSLGRV
jgi:O-antigen ligase